MPKAKKALGSTKIQHGHAAETAIEKVKWALEQAHVALEAGNCGKAYLRMGDASYYHGQYVAHRDAGNRNTAPRWPAEKWSQIEPMYARKCVVGYKSGLSGAKRRRR